mgnify:CR=1 FL=1
MKTVRLYTYQRPGRDITVPEAPHWEYTDPKQGAHYRLAQHLGWVHWIWAFPTMEDFENDYMVHVPGNTLWTLEVPQEEIKWLGLERHCEPTEWKTEQAFFESERAVREAGDIPEALVKAPIRPEWILWEGARKMGITSSRTHRFH